ncbi:MAG: hypothetical protein D6698_15050 [Gammaproteobacteria bacterium]|nr:MAG: hypothetical protein D6698_15050 [Gammaproteobacteria bacterium]
MTLSIKVPEKQAPENEELTGDALDEALAEEFARMAEEPEGEAPVEETQSSEEEVTEEVQEEPSEESSEEPKSESEEKVDEEGKPEEENPLEGLRVSEEEIAKAVEEVKKKFGLEDEPEKKAEEPKKPETEEPKEDEAKKLREELEAKIQNEFQLSEEEAEKLLTEPNEVLPKFASRLYMQVFDSLVQAMQQQLPTQVVQVVQMEQARQESERRFYAEWPELDRPEFKPVVERIAHAYFSQVGNRVPFEEAIKEIGAQAWVALRLPVEALMKREAQKAAPQQQEVPQAPAGRMPPGTGTPTRQESPKKELNVFEELAEEILNEDF